MLDSNHGEISPTAVDVSLQTPAVVEEGNEIVVTVDLSNAPADGLEFDLIVTLSATPGTASEYMMVIQLDFLKYYVHDVTLHNALERYRIHVSRNGGTVVGYTGLGTK